MIKETKYRIKGLILLISFMAFQTNYIKAQTNTNDFEIYYGGLTWTDIHCDSTKFAYIADKEIYLYDKINNKRYEIDSMVVVEIYPFSELIGYYVGGNKLPEEIAKKLYKYKIGIGILLDEIYYYNANNILSKYLNNRILQICGEQFLKMTNPVEYRPGWEKYEKYKE